MRRATIGLSLAAAIGLVLPLGAIAADGAEPDVCLSVRLAELPDRDAWPAVIDAVRDATSTEARPQLFPDSDLQVLLGAADVPAIIAITAVADGDEDLRVDGCSVDGAAWSARIGRTFLADGADRMLEVAPTTPGIDSNVEVEWYADEVRVRTWLEFAGPLDIPNGTCWIDDVLTVEAGVAVASGATDLRTSPFAESACGRFFDYLTRGGAGEQAVTLLPAEVSLPVGGTLLFIASDVWMDDDAILISGGFELR